MNVTICQSPSDAPAILMALDDSKIVDVLWDERGVYITCDEESLNSIDTDYVELNVVQSKDFGIVKDCMVTRIHEFEEILLNEPEQIPDDVMNTDCFSDTKEDWIEEVRGDMMGFVRIVG